jgi:hypothetical protein
MSTAATVGTVVTVVGWTLAVCTGYFCLRLLFQCFENCIIDLCGWLCCRPAPWQVSRRYRSVEKRKPVAEADPPPPPPTPDLSNLTDQKQPQQAEQDSDMRV